MTWKRVTFLAVLAVATVGCSSGKVFGPIPLATTGHGDGAPREESDGGISPVSQPTCAPDQALCGDRCVDLDTDAEHCGGCDQSCSTTCKQGVCCSTAACSSCPGVCTAKGYCDSDTGACAACSPGLRDCDGLGFNACEADLQDDGDNCGACGNACGPNQICDDGKCVCDSIDHGDCDGKSTNGCEMALLVDKANCGACGKACSLNQTCVQGACACKNGHGDCNGLESDGCEVALANSTDHCGTCGNGCGAGAHCWAYSCRCNTGRADCNGTFADGCEADLLSPATCGGCNKGCGANMGCYHHLLPFPGYYCKCDKDYADCDGSPDTGCEAHLDSDLQNCGGCGKVCALSACAAGTCS